MARDANVACTSGDGDPPSSGLDPLHDGLVGISGRINVTIVSNSNIPSLHVAETLVAASSPHVIDASISSNNSGETILVSGDTDAAAWLSASLL